jgi:hypothetical protein
MSFIEIVAFFAILIYILTIADYDEIKKFINGIFKTYTYYIKESDIDPNFKQETREIMKNSKINNKYSIKETNDQFNADIMLELVDRNKLTTYQSKPKYYPGTSKMIRYSLTWQQNLFYPSAKPQPYCAIDSVNWLEGVPESGLTIRQYREYVIQHEFLHGLGYDHQECNANTAVNGVCPILYQSTVGCPKGFKCGYEVADIDYSKKIEGATF